jgi:nicotinate-nucleotide adenylyltransferase
MTSARTIGWFGGSFNPPHIAHVLAGLYVLETAPIDELWFVPTWQHAFGKELASFEDRVAMCERAVAALGDRAIVSRIEQDVARERGGESRTLHMLEHLARLHPELRVRLIIGADILAETAKWYRWEEVCRLAPPIVVGRGGVAATDGRAADLVMPAISSTEVRRRLAAGDDASGLVPWAVLSYIDQQGLYR